MYIAEKIASGISQQEKRVKSWDWKIINWIISSRLNCIVEVSRREQNYSSKLTSSLHVVVKYWVALRCMPIPESTTNDWHFAGEKLV